MYQPEVPLQASPELHEIVEEVGDIVKWLLSHHDALLVATVLLDAFALCLPPEATEAEYEAFKKMMVDNLDMIRRLQSWEH